ncbi:hypothetical protein BHE74_00035643 [Ensete ventricosum]|nr:hypothetical protein GW17_00029590 [Ensete ventricosum]RWW57561.1 hypothetical protein BHE74_00035643 [Ensete ventricosum]
MELWRSATGREQMEDWRVRSEFAEEEDAITREDAMNRGFRSPIAGDKAPRLRTARRTALLHVRNNRWAPTISFQSKTSDDDGWVSLAVVVVDRLFMAFTIDGKQGLSRPEETVWKFHAPETISTIDPHAGPIFLLCVRRTSRGRSLGSDPLALAFLQRKPLLPCFD